MPETTNRVVPVAAETSCTDTREALRVRGDCPACGAASLFVGDGGYVTCSVLDCPDPTAPHKALVAVSSPTGDREREALTPTEFSTREPMDRRVVESSGFRIRQSRYAVVRDGIVDLVSFEFHGRRGALREQVTVDRAAAEFYLHDFAELLGFAVVPASSAPVEGDGRSASELRDWLSGLASMEQPSGGHIRVWLSPAECGRLVSAVDAPPSEGDGRGLLEADAAYRGLARQAAHELSRAGAPGAAAIFEMAADEGLDPAPPPSAPVETGDERRRDTGGGRVRIHNPKTGTYVTTSCEGRCYCHHYGVVYGGSEGSCSACGCPQTLEAWTAANACPSCGEQTVNGHCEDCQALTDPPTREEDGDAS